TRPASANAMAPFAGFALARMSYDFRVDGSERVALGSDTYVPLTLGVGIHRSAFAVIGETIVPVGLAGANRSLALRLLITVLAWNLCEFLSQGYVGRIQPRRFREALSSAAHITRNEQRVAKKLVSTRSSRLVSDVPSQYLMVMALGHIQAP